VFESLPLSHRTRFASARKSSDSIKSETFSSSCNKITDSVISAIDSDFVKRAACRGSFIRFQECFYVQKKDFFLGIKGIFLGSGSIAFVNVRLSIK
jgi:hypothetical protein